MGALTPTVARLALAAALVAAASDSGAGLEPLWPLANGRRDVMHGFQNPYSSFQELPNGVVHFTGFHAGLDLRASYLDDVVAMRAGIVRYSGVPFVIEVALPDGTIESDMYIHIVPEPWLPGDAIAAGAPVGRIARDFGPSFNHLHVNRLTGPSTPADIIGGPGGRKLLNPLAMFDEAEQRDPLLVRAAPQDANEDGEVFWVAPDGDPTTRLPYAFGGVELLLEATDRQSDTLYYAQVLHGVGYWIESRSGRDGVASAAAPYRLLRMNDAWRGSYFDCDALQQVCMLLDRASVQAQGPDAFRVTMTASYRLTRTSGFTGLGGEISALEAWRTDALRGTGSPNGTGGGVAREIHEARFPDGRYGVHALTEDLEGELDTVFDVVVDNFRPYVEGVRVVHERTGAELYGARWRFDGASGVLALEREHAAGAALAAGDSLLVTLDFSEPMASARLELEPALGELSALRSEQDPERRTRWSARVKLARLPRARAARLSISGADLAGTTLHPFASDAPLVAPFAKRPSAAPIAEPTRDTLHVVPLVGSGRHASEERP